MIQLRARQRRENDLQFHFANEIQTQYNYVLCLINMKYIKEGSNSMSESILVLWKDFALFPVKVIHS